MLRFVICVNAKDKLQVSFAVDGILLLGSLSITRAFLEVLSFAFFAHSVFCV